MNFWQRLIHGRDYEARQIGQAGEDSIAEILARVHFWGFRGMVLRNLYIPRAGGGTSEIDLIYITRKGIFVIESKNYSGWIWGSGESRSWTESLYAGKSWLGFQKTERHEFYNPVWQNQNHIRALRDYLEEDIPMFSLIVFSDHCSLRNVSVKEKGVRLCQQKKLFRAIRSVWWRHRKHLTREEVKDLYLELLPLGRSSARTRKKHVKAIKKSRKQMGICPRCGGKLVLRTIRSGPNAGQKFYGCSNFPECRYTREF